MVRRAVTGLTILLLSTEPSRARVALTLAISAAALGGRARLFAQESAVAMLVPGADERDEAVTAAGLPTRAQLLAMAAGEGVTLIACQTGLALTRIEMPQLVEGALAGGLMTVLGDLGDDRLVAI